MTAPTPRRGPGRPPGSDGAETRQRILYSAREVFATSGFDLASLKRIAEHAGLTRTAIANYYPGKMELYVDALESVHNAVVGAILSDANEVDGPVHARVMAVFSSAIRFSSTDSTFVRFFVTSTADAIHHPVLREQAMRPIRSVHDFVLGLLQDAGQRGELPHDLDIESTTQVLMDLIWGLAMDIGFVSGVERVTPTLAAIERILRTALTHMTGPGANMGNGPLAPVFRGP